MKFWHFGRLRLFVLVGAIFVLAAFSEQHGWNQKLTVTFELSSGVVPDSSILRVNSVVVTNKDNAQEFGLAV